MQITHNIKKTNTEIDGVELNAANRILKKMGINKKGFIPVGGKKVHVKYVMNQQEKNNFRRLYRNQSIESGIIRGFTGCLLTGIGLRFF